MKFYNNTAYTNILGKGLTTYCTHILTNLLTLLTYIHKHQHTHQSACCLEYDDRPHIVVIAGEPTSLDDLVIIPRIARRLLIHTVTFIYIHIYIHTAS